MYVEIAIDVWDDLGCCVSVSLLQWLFNMDQFMDRSHVCRYLYIYGMNFGVFFQNLA